MGGLLESIQKVYDMVNFYASNSVPNLEQIKQTDLLQDRAKFDRFSYHRSTCCVLQWFLRIRALLACLICRFFFLKIWVVLFGVATVFAL